MSNFRRIQLALLAVLAVVIAGSIGYIALGFSLLDAVYQTVTTITTVGFREGVRVNFVGPEDRLRRAGWSGGSCLVVTVVADGFPLAAGLGAAQGDDGVGAVDGPVHAGLLEALADDGLAAGLDDAGADEQAA